MGSDLNDQPWLVHETNLGFIVSRKSEGLSGGLPGSDTPVLLAECPDFAAADRVSEGLQALTRLCQCGAVQVSGEEVIALRQERDRLAEQVRELTGGTDV